VAATRLAAATGELIRQLNLAALFAP